MPGSFMSVAPEPAADAVTAAAERAAMARALAQVGLAMARRLEQDAGADPAGAALAFARISRAVRLSLLLEERFEAGGAAAAQARQAGAEAAAARAVDERRNAVFEAVEAALSRGPKAAAGADGGDGGDDDDDGWGWDEEETERLLAEADARIETEIGEAELMTRPVAELAARVCRDLGVAFDASAWFGAADGGAGPQDCASGDCAPLPSPSPFRGGLTIQDAGPLRVPP